MITTARISLSFTPLEAYGLYLVLTKDRPPCCAGWHPVWVHPDIVTKLYAGLREHRPVRNLL